MEPGRQQKLNRMKTSFRGKPLPFRHQLLRDLPRRFHQAKWLVIACSLVLSKSALAASADVSLTSTETPNPVLVGGNLTYTYLITNKGPDVATGIVVSNALPSPVIPGAITITNGTYTVTNNLVLFYPADLPAGGSFTLQVTCTPVNLWMLTNRVTVTAAEADPDTSDFWRGTSWVRVVDVGIGASLKVGRVNHAGVLLNDGRVLLTGGEATPLYQRTRTAEVYDPKTETFTLTGEMHVPRSEHTSTLLPDGSVLIAGGRDDGGTLASLEIYDPVSGTFEVRPSLSLRRLGHTATLLPDGRVLIAGGADPLLDRVEYYDYRDGTVSVGGPLLRPRVQHVAALLPDGKVLFAGGLNERTSAEVFDPQTGSSTALSLLNEYWRLNGVALLSGKVLICGMATAELYDPATGQFTVTGPPPFSGSDTECTRLKDGRVLFSGTVDGAGTCVYTPSTGLFVIGSPMSHERYMHTSTLLQDGRVLFAGGSGAGIAGAATSEIAALGVDMDLDGMEDGWELEHGFNPADRSDAVQDADQDGHTNLQEYLAGTDPHDPNSVMRITTCQMDAATFRIDFSSVLGKLYRVERTSNSRTGGWEVVADNVAGTGGIVRVLDTNCAGSSSWLYRVKLLL